MELILDSIIQSFCPFNYCCWSAMGSYRALFVEGYQDCILINGLDAVNRPIILRMISFYIYKS